ncbi:lipase 1 [Amyelois transitella]|uniref:lipase 1 n=1 Tax=Amyelois transitella TaxID=680683 RepID=UPI00067A950C|nr:lipase 1 [Amyelois transitella]
MITNKVITTIVVLVTINGYALQSVPHHLDITLPEDGWLNFTGLAQKYGLNCAVYDVTTEDGYILKLFHIPGNKDPVLIMHGILDTADTFILRGNSSLVAALHEQGYDVWVGNSRGSRYSRRHQELNPDTDRAFWNFSFHEMGYYDLPAVIDFILEKTGASMLSAIGHSQGNQIFYVLGASRPEYNEKINIIIALAPICFLHNVIPPVSGLVAMGPMLDIMLQMIDKEEILGDNDISRELIDLMCLKSLFGYKLCVEGVIFPFAGTDYTEFEPEFSRIVLAHYPSGTSRINAVHLMQVAQKREFVYFDHGVSGNMALYNSSVPPKYDLGRVTMKVALIAAKNDKISALRDVRILKRKLPNLAYYKVLDYPLFNHLDYNWGKNMKKYLFPYVFKVLRTFGNR